MTSFKKFVGLLALGYLLAAFQVYAGPGGNGVGGNGYKSSGLKCLPDTETQRCT